LRHYRTRPLEKIPPEERTAADLGLFRPGLFDEARTLAHAGRGDELVPIRGLPVRISARSIAALEPFRDPFGMDEPRPAIARVRAPILAFLGTDEAWVGSAEDIEKLRGNAAAAQAVETHIVEGMTHDYAATGHERVAAELIATWADRLEPK
jgi:hypothetical protein